MGSLPKAPIPQGSSPVSQGSSRASSSTITPEGFSREVGPGLARSEHKPKSSLSKLVPKKHWLPGVSKKQRSVAGSEASDTPRMLDQGNHMESPFGGPDPWSSHDAWRADATLDTARSDYSSIPSDTSSPRQWGDMRDTDASGADGRPGLPRSSSMRKTLKSMLSLKASQKSLDTGSQTPRDAPSKRTSSFSGLLNPRLSFSRGSKKAAKDAKSKLQNEAIPGI
ncbi:hypothetical protein WJX84_005800 [Apatococcus fuscideae]|uniref:Uncharacterized protein n=1 Tax=Apatococcus fuscideae TaxID=2026836 RepID=A0AAW1TCH7_9CHLO